MVQEQQSKVQSKAESKAESKAQSKAGIQYALRPFESECFHNRSLEILDWQSQDFAAAFGQLCAQLDLQAGDFCWLRLPATSIKRIQAATAAGFFFVESTLVPYLQLRSWDRQRYGRYIKQLVAVDEQGFDQALAIARDSFAGLRFNLDPAIGDERAGRRYRAWLSNALARGEDVRGILHHGQLAGFSLLRWGQDAAGQVDFILGGVRPDLKGSGLGMMLYASTIAYCQDNGARCIQGGISAANIPVLNLHAALGFSFKEPTVVLHYHVL